MYIFKNGICQCQNFQKHFKFKLSLGLDTAPNKNKQLVSVVYVTKAVRA